MKNTPFLAVLAAIAMAVALPGCSDDDAGTGKLSLAITDAPVDGATAVVVQFTGVEVKPADGSARTFDFDTPRQIDLMALTGTDSELLLDEAEVPAGRYNWVRLMVDANEDGIADSYIDLDDGSRHELEIPSGDETGLKLITGFRVPAGGAASFTLDFDLRKSVHEPMDAGDSFKLRPTLRIVDNAVMGTIAGTVQSELVVPGCAPAVYVFAGSGVTPDDVDTTAPDPVSSAMPELNAGTGDYDYTVGFLAPGPYTVSFTCDADDDDPATSDTLVFTGTQDATVVADQTTTVNFDAVAVAVGSIAGTVQSELLVVGCGPAVYVFTGSGVTPDDVDGSAPDPVATAAPTLNPTTGDFDYTVADVAAGPYTVSFTCGADDDNPATSETLVFTGTQDATVVADQATTVNFPPSP